jgi:hypothetical protein
MNPDHDALRGEIARIAEALVIGEKFVNACFSAWACGEPEHRVRSMLDRANEFQAALDGLGELDALPALAAISGRDAGEDALTQSAERVREVMDDDGGCWRSCSGCYETEDGYPVGKYPHSDILGCPLGGGCSECGGIGAVWDDTDYADYADWSIKRDRDRTNIEAAIRQHVRQVGDVLIGVGEAADEIVGMEPASPIPAAEAPAPEARSIKSLFSAPPPPCAPLRRRMRGCGRR